MVIDIVYLAAGLAVIYFGAEFLVRGSKNLALAMGIRPMIVGLTVVAFGTSMPEFFVSFTSALKNSSSIAVGNIVGSNICNIGLILGMAALVRPLSVNSGMLKREMPIMLGASLLFWALIADGSVGRFDGALLMAGIVLFTFQQIQSARKEIAAGKNDGGEEAAPENSKLKNLLFALGGIAGLVVGANLMITGAISLALKIGVSELVVGLSIVAFGTSLPELATSMVAAARKESDISIGNVVGSNIFNILFILGLTALVSPIPVEASVISTQTPAMLAFSVVLLPFMIFKRDINRLEGFILLAAYIAYVVWIFS
ncbi:MAG: Inner membrane protein YrbG [bacterium ADurb.Bin236]|nr:MAG: Inner membrane protein YrbG [bacterium ADurb.Bin236]